MSSNMMALIQAKAKNSQIIKTRTRGGMKSEWQGSLMQLMLEATSNRRNQRMSLDFLTALISLNMGMAFLINYSLLLISLLRNRVLSIDMFIFFNIGRYKFN